MVKENGSKKNGCLIAIIVVIILAVIGSMLDDGHGSRNTSGNSGSVPKEYEWVVGIWTCNTPYGIKTISLGKNWAFSDNDGHEGTFTIEDGRIYTHLNGTLGFAIEIDSHNRRIGPGDDYWMIKVTK